MPTIEPRFQSSGQRRELRRRIRNVLGVGREPAPGAVQALRAAHDMSELTELATDGRFSVAIIDRERGNFVGLADALRIAKGGVSS